MGVGAGGSVGVDVWARVGGCGCVGARWILWLDRLLGLSWREDGWVCGCGRGLAIVGGLAGGWTVGICGRGCSRELTMTGVRVNG